MANRFTDTEKWGDAWFMDLPSKYKIFWLYMLDSCNAAGIWEVNWKMAQFITGETLEPSEVKRFFQSRIIEVCEGRYWFIKKFIVFQQKTSFLNLKNSCHKGIYNILKQFDLLSMSGLKFSETEEGLRRGYEGATKPLPRGSGNSKGKGNGKEGGVGGDESQIMIQEDSERTSYRFIKPTFEEVDKYVSQNALCVDARVFMNHFESNGWKVGGRAPMKDWKAAVRNWHLRETEKKLTNAQKQTLGTLKSFDERIGNDQGSF